MTETEQRILEAIENLKSSMQAIERRLDSWPDLNFLQAASEQQLEEGKYARDFRRRVEIKLDEIYGSMATSSEIGKLREEVAESTERERTLDLRVRTIENRLGIKKPLLTE
jgi:hypothetical protein